MPVIGGSSIDARANDNPVTRQPRVLDALKQKTRGRIKPARDITWYTQRVD